MYKIWHVFVWYTPADSFRGITGVWTCGSKPDALAWPQVQVFPQVAHF